MTMAAIALSALLLWQGADDRKADDFVRDLGAEEHSVRERAEGELRKMGDAALPALRGAVEDKDPERALRARRLLEDLEKRGRRSRSGVWTAYRDFGRGVTFQTHPDGTVELTVSEPGKKGTQTYRADSLEDFKKKHPDLASKYDVDHLAPAEKWSFFDESKDGWEAWQKRFDRFLLPWFPFGSDVVRSGKTEPARPTLGVTVVRVPGALADQLGLGADEGLVIADVKSSSPAERAGLRKHDLLLKVDGKVLKGPEELRRDVEAGLRNGMEIEILRRGKRETLKIEPTAFTSRQ